jgi:GMP synthase-like glutamine amidotransferase
MLLLINNTISSNSVALNSATVSGVLNIRRALRALNMPFYEVNCYGIRREVLNPEGPIFNSITGVIISGSLMKMSKLLHDISKYVHILHYLQAFRHVPVLGICFGAQLLVVLYGGFMIDNGGYTCTMAPVEVLANHKLFRLNYQVPEKIKKTQNKSSTRTRTRSRSRSRINGPHINKPLISARFCFSDIPIVTNRRVKSIAWVRGNTSTLPVAFEFERGRVYGCLFHPEYTADTYYILKNAFGYHQ